MIIAVLSGKGGTGKTLLSVNLAALKEKSIYLDCDIEEPNGYLYFKPRRVSTEKITVEIPEVDQKKCNGCRVCVDFCQFNALAYIQDKLLVFPEICHSCGGCFLFCPQKALKKTKKMVGTIQTGSSQGVTIQTGSLKIGEATGVPIIKKMLEQIQDNQNLVIVDCPPGSACTVMESIKNADYCLLVTEPTLFGVHNLQMVHELVKLFKKPHGAILNKCLDGKNPAEEYCKKNSLEILGKIPYDQEINQLNSNGRILVRENEKYKQFFTSLFHKIEEVNHH